VPSNEHILAEIRRVTNENGAAPGVRVFANATAIPQHAWKGKYWRAWSDALVEAGFTPNALNEAIQDADLVLSLIMLTRKLKRFPAQVDVQMERHKNETFPSEKPFRRLGAQAQRIEAVRRYVDEHAEYMDVRPYLPSASDGTLDDPADPGSTRELVDGYVYMLKLGKHYKVGRSEAVPTRHRQINLELPEKAVLVHKIGTDDCAGIEAYWHQRFAAKRTNGEWFVLRREDVSAFKRRKFM
jgi:hypothetical protein